MAKSENNFDEGANIALDESLVLETKQVTDKSTSKVHKRLIDKSGVLISVVIEPLKEAFEFKSGKEALFIAKARTVFGIELLPLLLTEDAYLALPAGLRAVSENGIRGGVCTADITKCIADVTYRSDDEDDLDPDTNRPYIDSRSGLEADLFNSFSDDFTRVRYERMVMKLDEMMLAKELNQ